MQIDWFTFVAQLINFLILLYLLKRFLYGPILAAIARRQEKIEMRMQEAEQTRRRADEELEAHQRDQRELARHREEMLAEAGARAEERLRELMEDVRQEVEDARQRWQEAIEREKREYLADLRERLGSQVFAVTRRVLADLADEDLEERIVQEFLRRVEDAADHGELRVSSLRAAAQVQVRSSFDLPERLAGRVVAVVRGLAGDAELEVEIESDPSVICGVELRSPGTRLAWSVRDYLESLEELFFADGQITLQKAVVDEEEAHDQR